MFDLTSDDLSRSILDCPGGAASFAAEANDRGTSVIAVDPVYTASAEWLAQHAVDEAIRGNRHTGASVESFVWTFFTDIDDHLERRTAAARRFGADLIDRSSAYVTGSLPRLPFRGSSFDLVLSSHLLFMYADRLDEDFHVAAALELTRVARSEVRIFPLISEAGTDVAPLINAVREAVATIGATTTVSRTSYEFQRGGDEMLVITKSAD